ncbi:MAG: CAP-associated domain-containing protein [Halarsenatibacteraceae bacterium]
MMFADKLSRLLIFRVYLVVVLVLLILGSAVTGVAAAGITEENISKLEIGMAESELLELAGEPAYRAPTPYGYEWLVYNQDYLNYFQIGVAADQVVAIYSNSFNWSFQGVKVGVDISSFQAAVDAGRQLEFEYENATIALRPPEGAENSIFLLFDPGSEAVVHFFIDVHRERLTSILVADVERTMAASNLNYNISWTRGSRPDFEPEPITAAKQKEVDQYTGRQFQDLINSVRVRNGIQRLGWYGAAAEVAIEHSRDMYENRFFSHESPNTGSPGDRVQAVGIDFRYLLENLSYGYTGAIFAHEGLMNSYGHRQNILDTNVNAIGAGSYQNEAYTQLFLKLD